MLIILISSVFLPQNWLWVGRVLPLSLITLIHLWSCIECIRHLYTVYKGQSVGNDVESAVVPWIVQDDAESAVVPWIVQDDDESAVAQRRRSSVQWYSGGLIMSIWSLGCWAALPVVDHETFFAVSHRQCDCRMMLITQILYFTCVPGELVWSSNMAWTCCGRLLNNARVLRGSSSQHGGEDSHRSRAETRNEIHLESYPNSRDGLDYNGSISSVADLVPEGSSVKSLLKKHQRLGLVAEGSWPAKVFTFVS